MRNHVSQNFFVSSKSLGSHPALSWFLHRFMYHYNQSYNRMWSWDGCTAQHLTCPFRISEWDILSCVACLRQVDLATPIPLQFKLQPMSSNLTALRLATQKNPFSEFWLCQTVLLSEASNHSPKFIQTFLEFIFYCSKGGHNNRSNVYIVKLTQKCYLMLIIFLILVFLLFPCFPWYHYRHDSTLSSLRIIIMSGLLELHEQIAS